MKKLFAGILIGIAILFAFIALGGGKYVKTFGNKTVKAGKKLERFEKEIKDTTRSAKRTIDRTTKRVKQYIP